MKENTKRIAILPARGGSVRIPGKNIRMFCGKPMIAYPLEVAKQSGLFDVIHVSTESDAIASVCKELGFSMDFMRTSELAGDDVPILPVLKYVLETYKKMGQEFDELCLLLPCSPLLKSADLRLAAELYLKFGGKRSVISVTKFPVPIEWAFDRDPDGVLKPVSRNSYSIPSQKLKTRYYDAGAFDYMSTKRILSPSATSVNNFVDYYVGYVLPRERAIDIDEPEDWEMAEKLYKNIGPFKEWS